MCTRPITPVFTPIDCDITPANIRVHPELHRLAREIIHLVGTCQKDLCEVAWWLQDDIGWEGVRPCDVFRLWMIYRDTPEFGPEFPVGEEKKFRWEYERKMARLEAEDAARKAAREAAKPPRPARKPAKRPPAKRQPKARGRK
ncbi:hypothetical protein MMC30_001394 [Trapelia coarctata]|nr:hypothetical protein [Trapelia coarctata]